ncbi:MAG: hypothetical protein GC191_07810 [Azospirillum sp.]|nr:hypothetical protein [Azospirillum sp.]
MPHLDRDSFIELLDRLGSPEDEDVLEAARQIDHRVKTAGVSWDDLLVPPPQAAHLDIDGDDDEFEDEQPGPFSEDAPPAVVSAADAEADLALIERLLGEFGLAAETRRELEDFKADLAAGEFTAADHKYLRSLSSRLQSRR